MSHLHLDDPNNINQQQLEHLLQQQAANHAQAQAIQAQIDSLSVTTSTDQQRPSSIRKQHHHHRRRDVPRSMSTQGATPMSRHVSAERAEAAAIARSLSQRSAPSMTRSGSRGSSTRYSGKIPFASKSNTPVQPLTLPTHSRQDDYMLVDWDSREQPFNPYASTQPGHSTQRPTMQHQMGLQQVPEHGRILEDPDEYLARQLGTPIFSLSPAVPLSSASFPSTHRNSIASLEFSTPATPSTANLTHASTLDNSTMSRSTSLFNENFEMLRINSNASFTELAPVDMNCDQTALPSASTHYTRWSSDKEQAELLAGTGGVSDTSSFSQSFRPEFVTSDSFGVNMEKSESKESVSSTSSSRNRLRLTLQNQHAASRSIQPKGDIKQVTANVLSSHSSLRTESRDGLRDKVAISKPTYQRPKHERVFCDLCNSHPEGFRGEHELRRHQDREHKKLVKKWIVVEPEGEGHIRPIVPLSKCKACGQLRKTYGAYYNAAAHLRRTHFKPKSSKSKSKGKKEPQEKRGGKGGGDWPPMTDLKHWMKEVEVVGGDNEGASTQQSADGASDDEINQTANESQSYAVRDHESNIGTYDDTTGSAYQINAANPFDSSAFLDTHPDYMHQSLYGSPNQDSLSSFTQVFQSDPLALFDDSPYFNDPDSLTGSNLVHFSY